MDTELENIVALVRTGNQVNRELAVELLKNYSMKDHIAVFVELFPEEVPLGQRRIYKKELLNIRTEWRKGSTLGDEYYLCRIVHPVASPDTAFSIRFFIDAEQEPNDEKDHKCFRYLMYEIILYRYRHSFCNTVKELLERYEPT